MGYSYTGRDVQQNPEGTVDVVCAIDEELPVELTYRGPFDLVLCTEVLEHVADWDMAFRNLATLLGRGGSVPARAVGYSEQSAPRATSQITQPTLFVEYRGL